MPRPVPELETERLSLRAWTPESVDAFARICTDPEVMRYMSPPRPATRAEVAYALHGVQEHWQRYGYGHWAVHERETGRFVGRAGIKHHDTWHVDPDNTELGWLFDRAVWGRGYATEAAIAARDHCLHVLGSPEVIAITQPDNAASRRVMEKIGLTYAGRTTWQPIGVEVVWYALRPDGQPPTGTTAAAPPSA